MSTTEQREVPKRRTVRVRLDPRFLAEMLALPEGYTITAAFASSDPVGIDLVVASDQLPEVEHDAESPRGYLQYDVVTLDEGGTPCGSRTSVHRRVVMAVAEADELRAMEQETYLALLAERGAHRELRARAPFRERRAAYFAMWHFFVRLPFGPLSDAVQREAMRLRALCDADLTRVDQTILAGDPKRLGNCVAACVASFLGVPLEQVPHFLEHGEAMNPGEDPDHTLWWAMLLGYMAGHGYWPVELGTIDEGFPGEVLFVMGMSPRGVCHQVLYRDGVLWHDPHPSRAGLTDVREVLAWRPTEHDHTPTEGGSSDV